MQNASYVVIEFASMALAPVRGGLGFTPFRGRPGCFPVGRAGPAAYFADGGRRTTGDSAGRRPGCVVDACRLGLCRVVCRLVCRVVCRVGGGVTG